jgi:hypothetical protein
MKIVKRKFEINNLVMRWASNGQKNARHGKLAVKWERPYRVIRTTRKGVYALESLRGRELQTTFNPADLPRYYVSFSFLCLYRNFGNF